MKPSAASKNKNSGSKSIKNISYNSEAKKMESYLKKNGYGTLLGNTQPYINTNIFIKKIPNGNISVLHRIGKTNFFVEAIGEIGSDIKLDARTCAMHLKNMTLKQLKAMDVDSNNILDSNEFLK
ncbi:MAG: hypothetical protein ACP5NW_03070 [Candidatus Woesearchaeota archaeon]